VRLRLILLFVSVILLLPGCGVRTIYVPDGTPVRLRETVRGAKVWGKAKPCPTAWTCKMAGTRYQ